MADLPREPRKFAVRSVDQKNATWTQHVAVDLVACFTGKKIFLTQQKPLHRRSRYYSAEPTFSAFGKFLLSDVSLVLVALDKLPEIGATVGSERLTIATDRLGHVGYAGSLAGRFAEPYPRRTPDRQPIDLSAQVLSFLPCAARPTRPCRCLPELCPCRGGEQAHAAHD